jgi:hypothetical protein
MTRTLIRQRLLRLVATAALAAGVTAAPASAAHSQEAMFQDDALLVYHGSSAVAKTLDTLRTLGVDRIRVSVYWILIAPAAGQQSAPSFNAADPNAYNQAGFAQYDNIVRLARARGIAVNFNLVGPGPLWATGKPPGKETENTYFPSPFRFGQFAEAVGRRYSGTFVPGTATAPTTTRPSLLPLALGDLSQTRADQQLEPDADEIRAAAAARSPLPRVSYWSVWNEPNQAFFLTPQWKKDGRAPGGRLEVGPRTYRALLDRAVSGLQGSGHGRDTILIGELAPKGSNAKNSTSGMKPMRFLRRLYCVSESLRPLSGSYAAAEGCPTKSQRSTFRKLHPALFSPTGFAMHPYSLLTAPRVRSTDKDYVGLADMSRLTGTLARLYRLYGASRRSGPPIYSTEFGYQSKPPDPFGFPGALQSAFINEAEFMSYANPRIRAQHQFLLQDAPPNSAYPRNSFLYWGTFQTGLEYLGGRRKASFNAYRMPIYLPKFTGGRGSSLRVWGILRPARNGSRQTAAIQYKAVGSRKWSTIRKVTVANRFNVIDTRARFPSSGSVRIAWRDPRLKQTIYSRAAPIVLG